MMLFYNAKSLLILLNEYKKTEFITMKTELESLLYEQEKIEKHLSMFIQCYNSGIFEDKDWFENRIKDLFQEGDDCIKKIEKTVSSIYEKLNMDIKN